MSRSLRVETIIAVRVFRPLSMRESPIGRSPGASQFGGADRLSDVPLCMLGDMNEQSDHGGGSCIRPTTRGSDKEAGSMDRIRASA